MKIARTSGALTSLRLLQQIRGNAFGALYIAGLLHWVWFFSYAEMRVLDWKLSINYQSVLRDAIVRFKMPYVMTFLHYTDRYLGTPETPLSPQFLLLPFVSVWTFNVLNICMLYSIGFYGLVLLKRRYKLSLVPFTFLFLLYNFNGYMVARIGVGHTMWYGYYFLPFFHLLILDLLDGADAKRIVVVLTGTLVLMELQGSFHLYYWCVMYLLLTAVANPKRLVPLVTVVVWSALLCSFRFLPTAVSLNKTWLGLLLGYPTLGILLDALTSAHGFDTSYPGFIAGWWDLDCFVGVVGLSILVVFLGLYPRRTMTGGGLGWRGLFLPVFVMVVLSMGSMYGFIFHLPIPFVNSQRMPSRFIVLPLTACFILAAIQLQRFWEDRDTRPMARKLVALSLIPLAWELYQHAVLWTIRDVEISAWKEWRIPPTVALVAEPDMTDPKIQLYVHMVWASAAISGALALHWFYLFYKYRRRP